MKLKIYKSDEAEILAACCNTLDASFWRLHMVRWFGEPYTCNDARLARLFGKPYFIEKIKP